MSTSVLATIALAQAAFLGLLLALLLTRRLAGGFRLGKSRRDASVAMQVLSRWLAGEESEEHLRLALGRLPFNHMSCFLQKLCLQMGGEDWERVGRAVRRTPWFEQVRKYSRSMFWWRRLQSARGLMVMATQEDLPLIEALLHDDVIEVRRASVWILRRVQSTRLAGTVLAIAAREPRVLRAQILEVLAANPAQVVGGLVVHLRFVTEREELRTALALAEMLGVPSLLEHVLPHVGNPDFEIRVATARSLAAFPHPQSSRALVRLLEDPAWQVRAQAAAALGVIGAREAAGDLDAALADESWWVRLRSALALRRLGREGEALLERRRPEDDAYAFEMAQYVLRLDRAAIAEYSGAHQVDYSEAASSEHAA